MLTECKYVCLSCKQEFTRTRPGPIKCIHCEHPYADWVNYKEIIEKLGVKE